MNNSKGSLTVEAACTFPIFILVMMTVMSLLDGAKISAVMLEGLHDAGKQMAIYAYEGKSDGKNILSAVYAGQQLKKRLNGEKLNVRLSSSKFTETDGMIYLAAECRLPLISNILLVKPLYLEQQISVRAWCGRIEAAGEGTAEEAEEYVYVTVSGSVYHKNRACTHIRLSIRTIAKSSVGSLRNLDGGKYKPCESCQGGSGSSVYITDSGDRYHSTVGCSRLKRAVLQVPVSQVADWQPCKRCGG